jgi:uncharacterized membrane protein (UPF0127 family)
MMLTIAKTFAEKVKGFMGVDRIADDEAILFVGIGPNSQFHMRTVGCDITIAALDKDRRVIDKQIMHAERGGWTTPRGTVDVLEGNAGLFTKLAIGEEPDWKRFGGLPEQKKRASKTAQIDLVAEMTKEIMRLRFNGEDDAPMSVLYMSEVVGPEFNVQEVVDTDISLVPADADADRKYYGIDDVGPQEQAQSGLCQVLNDVLGTDAARFDGKRLLVDARSLEGFKWTIAGETYSGKRVISAHKSAQDGEGIAILCVMEGMVSVTQKKCDGSDYVSVVKELLSVAN